jgi:DNA-binding MarR family transcriptional regulator
MNVEALASEMVDNCLLTRTRRISRLITRIYEREFRPYGVSATQAALLSAIARAPEIRPTDLAEQLDIEKSTPSRDLARLTRANMIHMRRQGRTAHLTVTQLGRDTLTAVEGAWRVAQAEARETLGGLADDFVAYFEAA